MAPNRQVTALGAVVTITGALVMCGWFFDIQALKSILPNWVTMKFSTALCFLFSGLTLIFVERSLAAPQGPVRVLLPITVSGILLLMAGLLAGTLLGVHTGIEDLFVKEAEGAVKSTAPGRPSVGTMLDFILVAVAGILSMLDPSSHVRRQRAIGWVVLTVGALAVFGYVIDSPALYYTWEGFSTAMAAHTAILFVLLGLGLTRMPLAE